MPLSEFAHGISAQPWARAYGRRTAQAGHREEEMPEHQPRPELPPRFTHRPSE